VQVPWSKVHWAFPRTDDLVMPMLSWGAVRLYLIQGTSCIFHKVALRMAVQNGSNCLTALFFPWEIAVGTSKRQKDWEFAELLGEPTISATFLFKVNLIVQDKTDFGGIVES